MALAIGNNPNEYEIISRSSRVDSANMMVEKIHLMIFVMRKKKVLMNLMKIINKMDDAKHLYQILIRYGSKRISIIQFSPKVVCGRCPEARKIGEKHCLTFKFVKNETKLIRNILEGHGFREVHPSCS
ncbi:unnamed protein product [Rotaria sp. Silwood2]|nr:unnamed protein product [Rotaria sp. Silwood2]CAF3272789.1 unnamed protein product [Rotaria sp. Silwood2]CAF4753785.1 unnamed protein product [Rotaria sp. Silwood2]